MEKDQIILLEDRGLISITGEDSKNFLHARISYINLSLKKV